MFSIKVVNGIAVKTVEEVIDVLALEEKKKFLEGQIEQLNNELNAINTLLDEVEVAKTTKEEVCLNSEKILPK